MVGVYFIYRGGKAVMGGRVSNFYLVVGLAALILAVVIELYFLGFKR